MIRWKHVDWVTIRMLKDIPYRGPLKTTFRLRPLGKQVLVKSASTLADLTKLQIVRKKSHCNTIVTVVEETLFTLVTSPLWYAHEKQELRARRNSSTLWNTIIYEVDKRTCSLCGGIRERQELQQEKNWFFHYLTPRSKENLWIEGI